MDIIAAEFGDRYLADFDRHLQLLREAYPERPWPAWPADGYIAFNRMVLKEEQAFRKTGAYSASEGDIDRISEEIYNNPDVMNKYYLVGLYVTYFIWPHHYRMLDFYRREFLGPEAGEAASFAEWGVGHGLLSADALQRWPQAQAHLYDLSPHSLGFAQRLLARHAGRCVFLQDDVATAPSLPTVDRLVCSEVLEHVPRPELVLQRATAVLAPGGRAFLTAAIDAPQPDHIYLFRSDQEVFDMVAANGLTVRSHLSVVHPSRQSDDRPPRVLGLVVEVAAS
jgi:SAM-dependent methyltransferase